MLMSVVEETNMNCVFYPQGPVDLVLQKILLDERELVRAVHKVCGQKLKRYADVRSSINVPFDEDILESVQAIIAQQYKQPIDIILVLAIGGSQLATVAVHQAVNGILHNDCITRPRVYFVDTVSAGTLVQILTILQAAWAQKQRVVTLIVSKSGTTLETVANTCVIYDVLKRQYAERASFNVFVVTDANSPLHVWARQENITCLCVPKIVGGRYSMLTPVGLLPLGLIGVDIVNLCAGARDAIKKELEKDFSCAALSAFYLAQYYKNGFLGVDFFVGDPCLEGLGKWYRQLIGESLGKTCIHEPLVHRALVPTVSVCSNDLHSVMQLYIGGLPALYTIFVTVKNGPDYLVPELKNVISASKSMRGLMQALNSAVIQAYQAQNKPFACMELEAITAYELGYIMQTCMIQVMYLGALLDVNAFDQPHVELYKREVRLKI